MSASKITPIRTIDEQLRLAGVSRRHFLEFCGKLTVIAPVGSLFLLFPADPCVAVIPMIIAAAGGGWGAVGVVVVAYEVATIGTMVALVTASHAGARALRAPWLDRYGDATAGALIITLGATLAILGL